MSNRFDLEQEIMSCWNITTDLNVLLEEVIEGDLSKDQVSNVLLGLHQLYEIKFNKLFRTFEQYIKTLYTEEEINQSMLANLQAYNETLQNILDKKFGRPVEDEFGS